MLFITTSLRVHSSHAVKLYCMQYPWIILLFYPLPHPIYLSVSSQQSQLLLACTISPLHTLHYSPSFCTQLLLNSACQFSKPTATQLTRTHTLTTQSETHSYTVTQLTHTHTYTYSHSPHTHTVQLSNCPGLGGIVPPPKLTLIKTPFVSVSKQNLVIVSESESRLSIDAMQYKRGISHARYPFTHFKHHGRVLQLISNRMIV